MKIFSTILSLSAIIFFTACGAKQEQLVVSSQIHDYKVDNNTTLIKERGVSSDYFGIKEYSVKIPDMMRKGFMTHGFVPTLEESFLILKYIDKNATLISVEFKIAGHIEEDLHKLELIVPSMQVLINELDKNGYDYFQIIAPKSVSNLDGFPINNIADFSTYLAPEINNPSNDMDLVNGTDLHSSMVPRGFSIGTSYPFVIQIIEDPKPEQIVWNIQRNLNN